MEKRQKILIIVLVILILFVLAYRLYQINSVNMRATMNAVVMKVHENSLLVMNIEDKGLSSVGFVKEGNIGFKEGQEVLIYYDGYMLESYPPQLGKVEKIKILKEKSDVSIPDDVLRYYYSSYNNVNINISELTNKGLTITITDTNELPYDYSDIKYTIYKKVKNENYTGVGYKVGEDTEHSTAGYTRNRI